MNEIFLQLVSMLSVPPANLVYHLVILFVLNVIFWMALSAGLRRGWDAALARLALAGGAALAGHLALVAASLFALTGLASADRLLPPLEHFIDVVSIGLLAWAFIPLASDFPQASAVLAIGNLALATLVYAVFAFAWYNQPAAALAFNGSQQDWAWTLWGLVLVGVALLALFVRLRDDWGLIAVACIAMLAGYVLHLTVREFSPNTAGWVRLGKLVAYPLLAGVMLHRLFILPAPGELAAPASLITPWQVLETCRQVLDAPSLNAALQRVASAIGALLDAEIVAIGLSQADERSIGLAAVQQAGLPPKVGAVFDVETQPAIQRALAWQQPLIVTDGDDADQASLRGLLGGGVGPLYIYPLVHDQNISGVLIASCRQPGQEWGPADQQMLKAFAAELAAAAFHRRHIERLSIALAQHETRVQQMRAEMIELGTRLDKEKAARENERAEYATRLRAIEAKLAQAQRELVAREGLPPTARREMAAPPPAVAHKPAPPTLPPPKEKPAEAIPAAPEKPVAAALRADTSAYRNLFVEEALKHLETMGGALGRLKDARDGEAVAQLFRSAHTLKSMAAAMNYTMIARLAGMLSDAIKHIRSSDLSVTEELWALAGDTCHVVRVLLEDVRTAQGPSVDVAPLLERWGPFIVRPAPPAEVSARAIAAPPGSPTFDVRISLTPDCQLKAVRAIVILAQLRRIGKIVACQPDEATLRAGRIEGQFSITLATDRSPADVQSLLVSMADVAKVDVLA